MDLVQDGLITLYMEANNVEEYLQSARTRTRHLTISSSSSHSIPSRPTIRERPMPTTVQETLYEEKEYTPSPPPPEAPSTHHQPAHCPSLSQQSRERSNSGSPGPAHDHTHRMRPRRAYDEVEDVSPLDELAPLPNGISFGKTVSWRVSLFCIGGGHHSPSGMHITAPAAGTTVLMLWGGPSSLELFIAVALSLRG